MFNDTFIYHDNTSFYIFLFLFNCHIIDTIGTIDNLIEKYQFENNKLREFGVNLYEHKIQNSYNDICISDINIKYGVSLPDSKRITGLIPLLASNGISDYINVTNAKNAVVFGCRGTLGNVFYQEGDSFVLNTAFYISNYNQYGNLYFSLIHEKGLTLYQSGAAQPQITIDAIKSVKLKFPIDNKLNIILDLFSKNAEIINKLKAIKNILLQKYF